MTARSSFAAGRNVRDRKAVASIYRAALRSQLGRAVEQHIPGMRLRVLQIGLDGGRWMSAIDEGSTEFTGLSTDASDVAEARTNFPDHRFWHVTPEGEFPTRTESVDVVVAVLSVQSQPVPVQRWLLREMWRVARPGGWLLFADEFVPGGLYGRAWTIQGLTSFLDLLVMTTGTCVSLLHLQALRYPGDRIHRAAILNLAKIGVPTQW